jgi:hypothetical protein
MKANAIVIIIKTIRSITFTTLPFKNVFYQTVRFAGMLGFVLLAYYDYQKNQTINHAVIIYIALALLFQPFIKVALGRTIWNKIDVMVSMGLIISVFIKPDKV